jgi:hypothetical protein
MSFDKIGPLPHLLVTEAIRELEKHFEGISDRSALIEMHIANMGRKPGFAMVSQICRGGPESFEKIEDILAFVAGKFCQTLFGLPCKYAWNAATKTLSLSFTDSLPAWFQCLAPPGAALTPQQTFWFRSYAYFFGGVFCGALLHFGYRTVASLDQKSNTLLAWNIKMDELDGTWEFASN